MTVKPQSLFFIFLISFFSTVAFLNYDLITNGVFYLKDGNLFGENSVPPLYFIFKILTIVVLFFFAPLLFFSFLTTKNSELFESNNSFIKVASLYLMLGILGTFYLKFTKEPILNEKGYIVFINLIKNSDVAKKEYGTFEKGIPITFSMFVKVREAKEKEYIKKQEEKAKKEKIKQKNKIKKLEDELLKIHSEVKQSLTKNNI